MSGLIERLGDMADFLGDDSQSYFVAQSVAKEHAADLREALSRLQSLSYQLTGGWRDIESAPKDGTRVLLAEPIEGGFEMSVGWWRPYINDSSDAGWMDGTVQSWAYEENTILHPTHWQPLPSPPPPLPGGKEKP